MTLKELKIELNKWNIPHEEYSLLDGLKHDAIILENEYGLWHVYYYDERGNIFDKTSLKSECEACWNIFKRFREAVEIKKNLSK